jgi:hypothetical protein
MSDRLLWRYWNNPRTATKIRRNGCGDGRRESPQQMNYQYTYEDFVSSLKWLCDEGYIEKFVDEDGNTCVRICEGAEDCEI